MTQQQINTLLASLIKRIQFEGDTYVDDTSKFTDFCCSQDNVIQSVYFSGLMTIEQYNDAMAILDEAFDAFYPIKRLRTPMTTSVGV